MGMKHMETGGIIIVVSSCNSEGFAWLLCHCDYWLDILQERNSVLKQHLLCGSWYLQFCKL
jgi:hypothetical protein